MKLKSVLKNLCGGIRGVLGAFLLAFLAEVCWFGIIAWAIDWGSGAQLSLLLGFLAGPASCLGYWLFRGLRNRRFAYYTIYTCSVLALFPAFPAMGVLEVLPRCSSLAEALHAVRLAYESVEYWAIWIGCGFLVLLGARTGQSRLLRYTDPAWYKSPLRAALTRSGGALCNYWSSAAGYELLVPGSFDVNGGVGRVLRVRGDYIQVVPPLRKGRTFSAWDVAGVIIGPGNGYNVLYDFQGEFMARFITSEKNAKIFVQYLRQHGVPFYPVSGPLPAELTNPEHHGSPRAPEDTKPEEVSEPPQEDAAQEPEEEEVSGYTDLSCFSRDFSLQLRRTMAIETPIALGFFIAVFLSIAVTPVAGVCLGVRGVAAVLTAAAFIMIAPLVYAAVKGQLFTGRLSVESGQIWLHPAFALYRRIYIEDIGGLRFENADECYILYDKAGRALAKFSTRDEFGPQFLNFLAAHNIKPRSEK